MQTTNAAKLRGLGVPNSAERPPTFNSPLQRGSTDYINVNFLQSTVFGIRLEDVGFHGTPIYRQQLEHRHTLGSKVVLAKLLEAEFTRLIPKFVPRPTVSLAILTWLVGYFSSWFKETYRECRGSMLLARYNLKAPRAEFQNTSRYKDSWVLISDCCVVGLKFKGYFVPRLLMFNKYRLCKTPQVTV